MRWGEVGCDGMGWDWVGCTLGLVGWCAPAYGSLSHFRSTTAVSVALLPLNRHAAPETREHSPVTPPGDTVQELGSARHVAQVLPSFETIPPPRL